MKCETDLHTTVQSCRSIRHHCLHKNSAAQISHCNVPKSRKVEGVNACNTGANAPAVIVVLLHENTDAGQSNALLGIL
jgi:hypothetical protein